MILPFLILSIPPRRSLAAATVAAARDAHFGFGRRQNHEGGNHELSNRGMILPFMILSIPPRRFPILEGVTP